MARVSEQDLGSILWKLYERVLPAAAALLAGKVVGFAASTVVFTTWLLRRMGKRGVWSPEDDEAEMIRLYRRIREQEQRVEMLRRMAQESQLHAEALHAEEEVLRRLKEEYELLQLRIIAYRKLKESLSEKDFEKLWRELTKALERIEKGKEASEEEYRILKRLEDMWRSRMIEAHLLRKVIELG